MKISEREAYFKEALVQVPFLWRNCKAMARSLMTKLASSSVNLTRFLMWSRSWP